MGEGAATGFTVSTATSALGDALTVVTDALGKVVNMIASNAYLSIGFGIGLLGLGIVFVRRIRRL